MEPFITVNHSTHTSEESDISNENQHDFTLEKFLFYDDYLRSLYVMSKVYEACMLCKDILKVSQKNCYKFMNDKSNNFVV